MNRVSFFPIVFLFFVFSSSKSQDLEKILDDAVASDLNYVSATFKSTRIVNGHSIERMPEGLLDFRVSHRFGQINSGAYEFWGLDQANIRLALEYGITDWLMVGIGRSNYEKAFDGFAKFSIVRQSSGTRNVPVSISYLSSVTVSTLRIPGTKTDFNDRTSFVHQLLIARKINDRFSMEVNPTFVRRNMVSMQVQRDDIFAIGFGSRIKLSKRVSFNLEYYLADSYSNEYLGQKTYDPLSIGFDIETGGHVFQLFLSNSVAMIEKGFIAETVGDWTDGGIHFGFNISRVFNLKK
jgi:hypothetical protein